MSDADLVQPNNLPVIGEYPWVTTEAQALLGLTRELIAEVKRMKAALEHQTWCPDCGKVLEIPNPLAAKVERLEAEKDSVLEGVVDARRNGIAEGRERAAVIAEGLLPPMESCCGRSANAASRDIAAAIRADKGDSDE